MWILLKKKSFIKNVSCLGMRDKLIPEWWIPIVLSSGAWSWPAKKGDGNSAFIFSGMRIHNEDINSGFLRFNHSYPRKVFRSHWQPSLFSAQHGHSFLPASIETFIVAESIAQGKGNPERKKGKILGLCPPKVLFSFFLRPYSVEI